MIHPRRVTAIITAAGYSQRMGRLKALLPWPLRPLIHHQVNALREFGQIVVILGHAQERIAAAIPRLPRMEVLGNLFFRKGRSSSIELGARLVQPGDDAILLCAVDQPLHAEVLDRLLRAADPSWPRAGYQPLFQGRRGHPLLLAPHLRRELTHLCDLPTGLRTLTRRYPLRCVPMPADLCERDLNTPGDVRQARQAGNTEESTPVVR